MDIPSLQLDLNLMELILLEILGVGLGQPLTRTMGKLGSSLTGEPRHNCNCRTQFQIQLRLNNNVTFMYFRMTGNLVGTYRAIATNPLGEAVQDVKLELAEHPHFILRPKETFIMLRKGGKITAKVTGVPLPEIKFYKDWKIIGESSRLKFNISESLECVTITIELRDSILKDAGMLFKYNA